MPLNRIKYMPKILSIGAVKTLCVLQAQRLATLLHEIHELVHFQQCHERVQQSTEIAVHQDDQRSTPGAHVRDFTRLSCSRRGVRLENDRIEIADADQRCLDALADVGPIQTTKTAAERRDGDRMNTTV